MTSATVTGKTIPGQEQQGEQFAATLYNATPKYADFIFSSEKKARAWIACMLDNPSVTIVHS